MLFILYDTYCIKYNIMLLQGPIGPSGLMGLNGERGEKVGHNSEELSSCIMLHAITINFLLWVYIYSGCMSIMGVCLQWVYVHNGYMSIMGVCL